MKLCYTTAALLLACAIAHAQERPVPKDSSRISVTGCTTDRTFIVTPRSEAEPVQATLRPGRRFRLSGAKKILEEIKKQEGMLVEITGLVRKSDLTETGVRAGRVRIGGGPPRAPMGGSNNVGRDPMYDEAVMDVEAWRPLPESCPSR
jgi:hypothetical protein